MCLHLRIRGYIFRDDLSVRNRAAFWVFYQTGNASSQALAPNDECTKTRHNTAQQRRLCNSHDFPSPRKVALEPCSWNALPPTVSLGWTAKPLRSDRISRFKGYCNRKISIWFRQGEDPAHTKMDI